MDINQAFATMLDNIREGYKLPDVLHFCATQVDGLSYAEAYAELLTLYDYHVATGG